MNNLLEIQGLNKQYPSFALKDVSFTLPQGYIMGFIGPNGAGKTTTIKSILQMIHADSGSIQILGQDTGTGDITVKEDLGVVMDLPFYVDAWTCKDVEAAVRPFYRRWDSGRFSALLKQFAIDPTKKVKELSRGMKVKLMMAVALSHKARLLLLDEPTSGLDPVAREELLDILAEFMENENNGVLFSTHITSDLEKVADYITFLLNGQIVFTGLKDELLESYQLVKGGPKDLTESTRKAILGLRSHATGFEGMVRTQDAHRLPGSVLTEPISLEQLIVFMNQEGKKDA
jgi:ABC-2 type transport system ATP-binding protein